MPKSLDSKTYLAPRVKGRNAPQKYFLQALASKPACAFIAPAGCGKSFLTMSEVADWIVSKKIPSVTITRPAVSMGKTLGFLPGSSDEKIMPWLEPLLQVARERYGAGWLSSQVKNGNVELLCMEHARGRDIHGVLVVDEAQNTTPSEMLSLLTRIADGGQLILLGDPNQTDLRGLNGLTWLAGFVERHPDLQNSVELIHATSDHIERGGLCKTVVKCMELETA